MHTITSVWMYALFEFHSLTGPTLVVVIVVVRPSSSQYTNHVRNSPACMCILYVCLVALPCLGLLFNCWFEPTRLGLTWLDLVRPHLDLTWPDFLTWFDIAPTWPDTTWPDVGFYHREVRYECSSSSSLCLVFGRPGWTQHHFKARILAAEWRDS